MERSISGDSYGSPLLERPSYIASFDANRPRHHRRRSSIPVTQNDSVANTSMSANTNIAKHGRTSHDSLSPLRERRRFRENHRTASPRPTPSSSSRQHRRLSPSPSAVRRPHVSPDSSTDAFYSSTYAAGPSNPDTPRGYGGDNSSSEDESSSDDAGIGFHWDKRNRRSSMPVPQAFRAYLSPNDARIAEPKSPADWSSSTASSSSPLLQGPAKRLSAVLTNVSNAAGRSTPTPPPSTSISQNTHHRPPNLRPESLNVNSGLDSTRSAPQEAPSKSIPSSARLTPSPRLREHHLSPSTDAIGHSARRVHAQALHMAPRRSRSLNATVEMTLLIVLGVWACSQLRIEQNAVSEGKVGELVTVLISAVLYFFLASDPGRIWSTDTRSYRASDDDGSMCGILLGPLLAATMLISSLDQSRTLPLQARSPNGQPLPNPPWLVDSPVTILTEQVKGRFQRLASSTALTMSRSTLLSLQTLLSVIFLTHLVANKWSTRRAIRLGQPINLQTSWTRLSSYIVFSLGVTATLLAVKQALQVLELPVWSAMAPWELVAASIFYQTNMYSISRLGRRSFTLGELTIVAALGVTLTMEAINVTLAKLYPHTTPYLKTFRTASPLLVFQLTLIVGTFLIGFLLSPLLYLSRHLAQKPVHRLRWPHKRDLHRRLLAGFFYLFATAYVFGALGFWVKWILGGSNPWIWTMFFIVQGQKWWTRPALIVYWLAWITASIAGWQAVVVRAKRFRSRQAVGAAGSTPNGSHHHQQPHGSAPPTKASQRTLGWDLVQTGSALQAAAANRLSGNSSSNKTGEADGHAGSAGVAGSSSSTAAKIKKSAHLSLNARRKFFHALAVILYTPGIALDPAFMHLAFSLAFSVFTFAEYIRYYALYPFGASLHIFLSEFTDHKDSGPVILSHFYLLTGCCGGLWLEGEKQITHQTGVLVLGIGDALASVVGKRYGRLHWPKSSKTIEGSLAFLVSVTLAAWVLRLVGWCEYFNLWRYSFVVSLLCLMEGVSEQNDNLVLPIVAFIALSLAKV